MCSDVNSIQYLDAVLTFVFTNMIKERIAWEWKHRSVRGGGRGGGQRGQFPRKILGRIWLAGEGCLTSRAHLVGWVRGVLHLGRIWLAGEGYLTSGAHLVGWWGRLTSRAHLVGWWGVSYVWGASGWLVRGVLRLGRIWLAGWGASYVWGASAWLVKGVLCLGRIWLTRGNYLRCRAHLVGW